MCGTILQVYDILPGGRTASGGCPSTLVIQQAKINATNLENYHSKNNKLTLLRPILKCINVKFFVF